MNQGGQGFIAKHVSYSKMLIYYTACFHLTCVLTSNQTKTKEFKKSVKKKRRKIPLNQTNPNKRVDDCYELKQRYINTTFLSELDSEEGLRDVNYGQRCIGLCKDSTSCNHLTGQCDEGCDGGWTGKPCNIGVNNRVHMYQIVYSTCLIKE